MSPKIQRIVLGILVATLVGVAIYVLLPAAGAPPEAAAAGAEASATAATAPTPTVEELNDVADWFAIRTDVAPERTGPILGLEQKTSAAPVQPPQPVQTNIYREPRLEGIIGDTAIYTGEAYRVGDKLRGTKFKLIAVGKGFVWIEGEDGRKVQQFWQD